MRIWVWLALAMVVMWGKTAMAEEPPLELLNVSYDPTRQLYKEYNELFRVHWRNKTGQDIIIRQSHAGSAKQARAVLEGLPADVVTLALPFDVDIIAEKSELLPKNWREHYPHQSIAYRSTIVFLVRKSNPKKIKDWDDLIRKDVAVITPNPKTSGGARWNYLAAYGYGLHKYGKNEAKAEGFMKKLYANVPVLDAGARGATTTFVQREMGDVLITWENEAYLAMEELGKDQFEIVIPSVSVLAELPVAVVEKNAVRKHTLEAAREYVAYLYSPEAQTLIAKHYYRPVEGATITLMTSLMLDINYFGGWEKVQQEHFADDGMFDRIMEQPETP